MINPKLNCLSKILHPSRKPKPTFTIMLRMQLKSGEKEPELSFNLQEDNTESLDNVDDENADEYGYFSEFEKGTHHMQHQQAQQLGLEYIKKVMQQETSHGIILVTLPMRSSCQLQWKTINIQSFSMVLKGFFILEKQLL